MRSAAEEEIFGRVEGFDVEVEAAGEGFFDGRGRGWDFVGGGWEGGGFDAVDDVEEGKAFGALEEAGKLLVAVFTACGFTATFFSTPPPPEAAILPLIASP